MWYFRYEPLEQRAAIRGTLLDPEQVVFVAVAEGPSVAVPMALINGHIWPTKRPRGRLENRHNLLRIRGLQKYALATRRRPPDQRGYAASWTTNVRLWPKLAGVRPHPRSAGGDGDPGRRCSFF